ncbi:MAG: putative addiction module component [Candidatus Scalindua rubra]|uniref:Putative addiction module component n=1 Tax=Candidatus Scalindua rubra TaxID=1872076 RepID=A0A1E3X3K4_9BACT|nr:MAG: putative addiction module component [Candidatus Scalindua rubra]
MSKRLEKMAIEAMSLSVNERAKLAHDLIVSIDEEKDVDVKNAWEKEIDKRTKEIKMGIAKGRPAEQVLAEIRAKYEINNNS